MIKLNIVHTSAVYLACRGLGGNWPPQRIRINSTLTDLLAVLQFAIVSNLSADRFEYTCPVRYTEIDPRCG